MTNNTKSIIEAVSKGNVELIQKYIETGGSVKVKDNDGVTPLHVAVLKGHSEMVDILIAAGADVSAQTKIGNTPLDIAQSTSCSFSTIELLEKSRQQRESNTRSVNFSAFGTAMNTLSKKAVESNKKDASQRVGQKNQLKQTAGFKL